MDKKPTYKELEQRVKELEKEVVAHQVARKSPRGYLDAAKSLGTIVGYIVHDINNLLMGIQGHISLMALEIDAAHPHY